MALLLQIGFGFSAFHAGLMLLAGAIGSTVMRFTFRPMLNKLGFRRMLIWQRSPHRRLPRRLRSFHRANTADS